MIKDTVVFVLSFLIGQYSITSGYDPEVLESAALTFIGAAYYSGCTHTRAKDCNTATKTYVENVKDIWRNNAWKAVP